MSKKERSLGRLTQADNKISNTKNALKANKSIAKCFECSCSVMKLSNGKVIQYCLTYTMPCQDAIKICVVI